MKDIPRPDAVLLILDSTNLSRHLVLAAPVLSLGLPTLVILNMADDLKSRGGELNVPELSMQLGSPVALVSAAKGIGVEKIFQFLSGATIGAAPQAPLMQLPVIQDIPKCRAWATHIGNKTGYHAPAPPLWTRRLDAFFLHPVAGPLVFLLVVVAVFQTIFNGARPLMDGIDALIKTSGVWLGHLLPNEALRSLVVDGIWTGVGSVVVFLPQILLLFLFIGILEDSGYLARAALIADRTMARFGLQGKSFIPLLSAYACAVPAIMATRTIENKRDRIATILIAPFMTCSARLPVYILIIGAFIPDKRVIGPFLGMRAAVLLGLYVLGFVAAILTARLLKIHRAEEPTLVVHAGNASLPLAHGSQPGVAHGRSVQGLPGARGNRDPGGRDRHLGSVVSASARRKASGDRAQHRRRNWAFCRTRHPAAGLQLEDRHRPDHVAGGARNHRQHAGNDLRHERAKAASRACNKPCIRT